jgi:hypothetical protein
MKNFWNKDKLNSLINNYNNQIKKLENELIYRCLINNNWNIDSYFKTIKKIKKERNKLILRFSDYATKN